MTPRDNLLSLYRRQGYETVPVEFGMCPSLHEKFKAATGSALPPEEYFAFPFRYAPGLRLPARAPIDWTVYYPGGVKPGTTFSAFGVAHEPGSAEAMHMSRMRHPMESFDDLAQLQAYPFPDYAAATDDHMAGAVAEIHARGLAAYGGLACTVWEASWYIRGMEPLMMDMMADDDKATFLLDTITDIACLSAAAFARAGVDVLALGDDVGMQSQLMMAPTLYRDWLKPRLAKVIRTAKAIKPDILVHYHSCGYVIPVIDDLIEAGVDILNPVQPECMDFAQLHAEYGDRLSFNGTLGTQTTMPFGTPDDVRAVVERNLRIAGAQGGLVVCPTHMLEPEVPWENVEAYAAACRDFSPARI